MSYIVFSIGSTIDVLGWPFKGANYRPYNSYWPRVNVGLVFEVIDMGRASLIWRQYRASVWLKPYPAKQCTSAHSHHQSCHSNTFANAPISYIPYFLYHPYIMRCLIRRIFIYLYTGVSTLLCSVLTFQSMAWLKTSRSYTRSASHAADTPTATATPHPWYIASIRASKAWYVMSYNRQIGRSNAGVASE